jgi:aminopeptidase N
MIETTEALYGPYRWGRYDLLILPPSFPYGGMENPRLTFITPTVIVGDKQPGLADRARAGAFVVRQPGHQQPAGRTCG